MAIVKRKLKEKTMQKTIRLAATRLRMVQKDSTITGTEMVMETKHLAEKMEILDLMNQTKLKITRATERK